MRCWSSRWKAANSLCTPGLSMIEEWLVDGYNLFHEMQSACGDPKFKLDRASFCGLLAGFAATRDVRMLAILDGSGEDGELKTHETSHFKAIYSHEVSADAWIERYVFEKRATTRLTVVTSDRAICEISRGGGASIVKASQFCTLLRESKRDNSRQIFKEEVRSHGFHRPLDEKLRQKGLIP